jgi:hypothetical protein
VLLLRDIQHHSQFPSGDLEAHAIDPRKLVFNQIRHVIKSTRTRHTARTAFRSIEEKIARPLLSPTSPVMSDGGFNLQGDVVELAVQQRIDELGFMLRAPISVLATVPFVFGLPVWPWIVVSRAYHLEMDVIRLHYKDDIIDPWIKSLEKEGERCLIGAIQASSKVAKGSVTSTLEREDNRYKRELEEKKQSMNAEAIQYLISVNGNTVAAEEALKKVFAHVKQLKEQSP